MIDFFYRTEDIKHEEVLRYFVETSLDRGIVNALKARNPVILIGSRGVGKSFLLRVAEAELWQSFEQERIFPVYLSFNKSSLIHTSDPDQFKNWMLATIYSKVIRALYKSGLVTYKPNASLVSNEDYLKQFDILKIEEIAETFENSWKTTDTEVDTSALPVIDVFRDAIQDTCTSLNIQRFSIFIDEAAHIFLPQQQRDFFTLFRDLRSPYLTCNAAVYPGVTSFGDIFEPSHDATMLTLNRDILDKDYVTNMREIVEKQVDDTEVLKSIIRHGEIFSILAYAASGNPRILLKTLGDMSKFNATQVNEIIREFYRTSIWSDHTQLGERYSGHKGLVDWGRQFIEMDVLPELKKKNDDYLINDKATTSFFWIHRDAPQPVKESLRLLAYTGIVSEHGNGIKATRSEVGTRYIVNLGCLLALETIPTTTGFEIARNLTPKRMTEYGVNHPTFQSIISQAKIIEELLNSDILEQQLRKEVSVLDITEWQKNKLLELGINTIGGVLQATEDKLQEAKYVGEVRSRRMRNAAIASAYEYLSG